MAGGSGSPTSKRKRSSGSGSGGGSGSDSGSDRSGSSIRTAARPSGGGSGGGSRSEPTSKSKQPSSRSGRTGSSRRPDGGGGSASKKSSDADLLSRSRDFRRNILTPSGGWLNDIVVGASSVTGVSDFFLLGTIFVGAWVILRLTEREISLVLGLGFDLTIPLQHSMSGNKAVTDRHKNHLERYWPIFFMGTALEFGCLFLVHPTLFTLVVCLKTAVCTTVWFAQGSDLAPRPSIRSSKPVADGSANRESRSQRPPSGSSNDKDKEARKKMTEAFVKSLRENGFKSGTACNMLARKICKEKSEGDMQKKLKAMIGASKEEKAEMEKKAKEEYEQMKASRG